MPMYNPANTLAVTKSAIAQLIGKGYLDEGYELTDLDDNAIVDLGKKLELSEDGDFEVGSPADIVYKSFLSQLGRIVIDTRAYVAQLPSLYVDPIQWGLFEQFVSVSLSDVMIDEMWNPNGFIPWGTMSSDSPPIDLGAAEGARIAAIEYGFYRPAINSRLYKKAHGIMVAITRAYDQLFTAFRGVAELNEFLAGLYNSVENTLQLKAEVYAKMTVSMGIATAFANGNAIDLRSVYDASGAADATTATAEELLLNNKFQELALQTISETMDYIRDYTALFNDGEDATFASDVRTILLSKFERAAKFGVRANTYNETLLGIGDFDTVTKWQAAIATGESSPYGFTTISSIDLSKSAAIEAGLLPAETEETHYLLKNVVGVVYDRLSMGITLDKRKVTTNYAASRDTVNSFYHSFVRYQVNTHYPIVSFYISDPDVSPEPTPDDV